jgi:predicted secreted Zn-dependent protease
LEDVAPSYILQHEQIHFAIAELAARDLTKRVRQLSATGDSPEQTAAALQRAIDGVFRDVMEQMTERNTNFDLDTSGRHDPERQQRWLDQVSGELAR